jgi:hypothetical protein
MFEKGKVPRNQAKLRSMRRSMAVKIQPMALVSCYSWSWTRRWCFMNQPKVRSITQGLGSTANQSLRSLLKHGITGPGILGALGHFICCTHIHTHTQVTVFNPASGSAPGSRPRFTPQGDLLDLRLLCCLLQHYAPRFARFFVVR